MEQFLQLKSLYDNMKISEIGSQIYLRCIYDNHISNISFDKQGVCNYSHKVDNLANQYATNMA
jgi:hypothetical protein